MRFSASVAGRLLGSIPSPSSGEIPLGPLRLHAYGLCIAMGVVSAVWLSNRRWLARGGHQGDVNAIATWAVPAGVIGARMYHVATDWRSFRGRWLETLYIWQGGLGIWGGVLLGVLVGVFVARRRGLPALVLVDVAAPAIPLAQAIGRLGNWFNQELFGRPTTLPWALRIDVDHRPKGYAQFATFHPTFLYELLWDLAVVCVVLLVERRWGRRLRTGRLFAVYVSMYTLGRFFIERVRIDTASRVGGLRINEWVAGVVFVLAATVLVLGVPRSPDDQRVAKPAQ